MSDELSRLRYEHVAAQLEEIIGKLKDVHTCPYDKICLPEHHYWASHNLEIVPPGRLCLCGKRRALDHGQSEVADGV